MRRRWAFAAIAIAATYGGCVLPEYAVDGGATSDGAGAAGGSGGAGGVSSSGSATTGTGASTSSSSSSTATGGGFGGAGPAFTIVDAITADPRTIGVDDVYVYWVDVDGLLWKHPKDGTGAIETIDPALPSSNACGIALDRDTSQGWKSMAIRYRDGAIWFIQDSAAGSVPVSFLGGDGTTADPGEGKCLISLDAQPAKLCWFDFTDGALTYGSIGGGMGGTLGGVKVPNPGALACNDTALVAWSNLDTAETHAIGWDGFNDLKATEFTSTYGICWPDRASDELRFGEYTFGGVYNWLYSDGAGEKNLLFAAAKPRQVACDANGTFVIDWDKEEGLPGDVYAHDGTIRHEVALDQPSPCGLAIDDNFVYWATCGSARAILRATRP